MESLLVERSEGIVWATLNRPERRNALSLGLWRALHTLFQEVAARTEDRVLVLQGAGGNFCSGGDLVPEAGEAVPELDSIAAAALTSIRNEVGRAASALHGLEKVSIACVNGTAAGAGASLAFSCDLTYAAADARFGLVFVDRGLSLDFGASWLLPRLIGLKRAKQLALFADWLGAQDAVRWGLVNEVFAPDTLVDAVRERAGRLARKAPLAMSVVKKSLDRGAAGSLADALENEALAQAALTSTQDFQEGMRAFSLKREAKFTGS